MPSDKVEDVAALVTRDEDERVVGHAAAGGEVEDARPLEADERHARRLGLDEAPQRHASRLQAFADPRRQIAQLMELSENVVGHQRLPPSTRARVAAWRFWKLPTRSPSGA